MPAPSTPASAPGGTVHDEGDPGKRLGLGLDLQLLVPFGTLADATGVMVGPLARVGYRATSHLELTFRAGFLFGLNRAQQADYSTSLTLVPLWAGARYSIFHPTHGLYAAAEIGANLTQLHLHSDTDLGSEASKTSGVRGRGGFDLGVGWVISDTLPIDVRAQYTYLNVLGTQTGDDPFMGLGLSVGYTLSF